MYWSRRAPKPMHKLLNEQQQTSTHSGQPAPQMRQVPLTTPPPGTPRKQNRDTSVDFGSHEGKQDLKLGDLTPRSTNFQCLSGCMNLGHLELCLVNEAFDSVMALSSMFGCVRLVFCICLSSLLTGSACTRVAVPLGLWLSILVCLCSLSLALSLSVSLSLSLFLPLSASPSTNDNHEH